MHSTTSAALRALGALLLAAATLFAAGPARAAGSGGDTWGAGYFPNIPLTTQDGRQVRFFDDLIKGKVVAINFIFTGCSAACSMETARLRHVQELLGDRVGKDVFFLSISIDPENDTPEALKAYAEKFDVAPGWTFLTGNKDDILKLRQRLGLYMDPRKSQALGPLDHDLTLIIGNQATGRWMKASPMENPKLLAVSLGESLHNHRVARTQQAISYTEAPVNQPRASRGEELFRTRCLSCHSIGNAGEVAKGRKPIGPDLAHVTKTRDRSWLARWLKEPDVMLAEKDPLATALYRQWNKLAMPNLKLDDLEVRQLIAFLEEAGAAAAATAKKQ
jgi:protein SCO1